MTRDEAERMLGAGIDAPEPAETVQRRAFLSLPADKRRQLLAEQAKLLSEYYETEAEYLTSEDPVND